jgi:hypothetical protein
LLRGVSRVPRACRAATDPADGMMLWLGGLLDLGDVVPQPRPHLQDVVAPDRNAGRVWSRSR